METPPVRAWTWLVGVHPDRTSPRAARLFGMLTMLSGVFFFAGLPSYAATVGFSPLWFGASGVISALIIGLGVWIGWRHPARGATALEQRQGRIIATIALSLCSGVVVFMWFDPTFYRTPLDVAGYLIIVVITAQVLWLARVGMVQISSRLLVVNVFSQIVANLGDVEYAAVAVAYVILLLIAGLLVRWWSGLPLVLLLPLLTVVLVPTGLIPPLPPIMDLALYSLIHAVVATITALYARSLEAALRETTLRAEALAQAEAALLLRNQTLEHQSALLVATQAQLEQTIAAQDARIADAVAELRTRSVELSTIQTPLIRVSHDTLVAPLIGRWDTLRATQFVERLLGEIARQRSRSVILDLTGLTSMSDPVAAMVGESVHAARLLGCTCILVGVQPETAQALSTLQDVVAQLRTASDLAAGLRLVAQLRGEHIHAPM